MAKKAAEAVKEVDEEMVVLETVLDEELAEDLDDEDVLAVDDELDDEVVVDEDEDTDEIPVAVVRPAEDEDDDIPDADDVEASLDVILKERLVVEDEVEDEETVELDDRGEATERVLPKQADEFVCNSCFLVKNASQLANKKKGLCRDCA